MLGGKGFVVLEGLYLMRDEGLMLSDLDGDDERWERLYILSFRARRGRGYAYLFGDIAGVGLFAFVRGAGSDSFRPHIYGITLTSICH